MSAQTEVVSAAEITPLEMPIPDAPTLATAATPDPVPSAAAPASDGFVRRDSKGTPFDPARHLPKTHPVSGCWMPKGGRKKGTKNAVPSGVQTSFIPAEEPPLPPAAEATETAEKPVAEPAAETRRDCSGEAAECATSAAEFVAGIVFDDPECAATGKHRDNLVKHAQSFIQAKGWQFTAGAALCVVLLAWILRIAGRPKPREKIRAWLSPEARARNVTPAAPEPAATASAPSSPRPAPGRGPIIDVPSHIPPLA